MGDSLSWSGKCSWEDSHSDPGEERTRHLSSPSGPQPAPLISSVSPIAVAVGKRERGREDEKGPGARGAGLRLLSRAGAAEISSRGQHAAPASPRLLVLLSPQPHQLVCIRGQVQPSYVLCLTTDSHVPANPIPLCGSLDHCPGCRGCRAGEPACQSTAEL